MSILYMRLRAVVGTLVEVRAVAKHPKDAAWATSLIRLISGADGFNKLVKFAVDCDFAVAAGLLIRLQDKPSADIAVSVTEVTECLEICHVLCEEGHALDLDDNSTYTGHLLRSFLRPAGVAAASAAAPSQRGAAASSQSSAAAASQKGVQALVDLGIGWPAASSERAALAEGRRYARTLYNMAYKFAKLNYADYRWRTKFGAFNCGAGAFPEAYRLDC